MAVTNVALFRVPCFEPTYEGLKHRLIPKDWATPNRFEPTYEGLKHFCLALWIHVDQGFEPTYEGLKLPHLRRDRLRLVQF